MVVVVVILRPILIPILSLAPALGLTGYCDGLRTGENHIPALYCRHPFPAFPASECRVDNRRVAMNVPGQVMRRAMLLFAIAVAIPVLAKSHESQGPQTDAPPPVAPH